MIHEAVPSLCVVMLIKVITTVYILFLNKTHSFGTQLSCIDGFKPNVMCSIMAAETCKILSNGTKCQELGCTCMLSLSC